MSIVDHTITSAEAAAILNVERRTVARLARTGALTFARKLPGRTGGYLFERGAVEALADDRAGLHS